MLEFFKRKKKNINTDDINNFNNALKVVDDFVSMEDFEKATLAINEIKTKETESFNEYIENITNEKEKKSKIEEFKEKLKRIQKIKNKIDKKKVEYDIRFKKKEREIEKKQLENLIKELLTSKSYLKAAEVLSNFMEKNQDNDDALNYVNKKKKEITKILTEEKKKKEKEIKKNTMLEARELVGEIQFDSDNIVKNKKGNSIINFIKSHLNLKKKLKEKRLLEEVNLLIQNQNNKNDVIARAKLEQIHSGLSKEISGEKINGYDLYGKIMGAAKISGDALGFSESKKDYNFFIGDATGHGIKAGITISNLTKKFIDISRKLSLIDVVIEINNSLKQDLSSGNFITSVFFAINKKDIKKVTFIGMGHEPIFIYRKKTRTIEKIIPGGLAAGIRIIKDKASVKPKNLFLEDGDILISYTDGFTEAKNETGKMYSIDQVGEKFLEYAKNEKFELQDIYDNLINDLKRFTGGRANFNDDVTIVLLKRDKQKEILDNEDEIEEVILKEGLYKNYKRKMKGKTIEEIKEDIKKIQQETAIKNIIKNLENLYRTGEIIKLKQDAIRYIKEGYIHKKINFYLKKAMDNENTFKIKQKNKKLKDKYSLLKELYKKGDYETVIYECTNIISKDGNI